VEDDIKPLEDPTPQEKKKFFTFRKITLFMIVIVTLVTLISVFIGPAIVEAIESSNECSLE